MGSPRRLFSVFAIGGLGGALFDQIHVRFGVLGYPRDDYFHYNHPQLASVPLWLPGLYLHVAPLAVAFARALAPARADLAAPSANRPDSAPLGGARNPA